MSDRKRRLVEVQGTAVTILSGLGEDYISLTDIAKHKEPDRTDHVIQNWMRNRNTIEFLGVWERLNNADFNPLEFEGFRNRAGLNSFVLTPRQWIESTHAIGLTSMAGRYGGTFAHKDIAFEFASWISVEFKLYLIKEFQRLKVDENRRLSLAWNLNRTLSKLNYRIHTDAIKAHLIPAVVTPAQAPLTCRQPPLTYNRQSAQPAETARQACPDSCTIPPEGVPFPLSTITHHNEAARHTNPRRPHCNHQPRQRPVGSTRSGPRTRRRKCCSCRTTQSIATAQATALAPPRNESNSH